VDRRVHRWFSALSAARTCSSTRLPEIVPPAVAPMLENAVVDEGAFAVKWSAAGATQNAVDIDPTRP
jgi:hypothetical protein